MDHLLTSQLNDLQQKKERADSESDRKESCRREIPGTCGHNQTKSLGREKRKTKVLCCRFVIPSARLCCLVKLCYVRCFPHFPPFLFSRHCPVCVLFSSKSLLLYNIVLFVKAFALEYPDSERHSREQLETSVPLLDPLFMGVLWFYCGFSSSLEHLCWGTNPKRASLLFSSLRRILVRVCPVPARLALYLVSLSPCLYPVRLNSTILENRLVSQSSSCHCLLFPFPPLCFSFFHSFILSFFYSLSWLSIFIVVLSETSLLFVTSSWLYSTLRHCRLSTPPCQSTALCSLSARNTDHTTFN